MTSAVAYQRPRDYKVKVSVGGLTAPEYPLAVWFRNRRKRDINEIKAMRFERIRLDSTKADALLALARSTRSLPACR